MTEVVTWNVLHRIHAVNWHEPAIDAHPEEAERIAAITAFVVEIARRGSVICLQEASGDQLASLASALELPIHAAEHARVPRLRSRGVVPALADPRELLVTVGGTHLHAETFPTDRGKGYLATRHGGLVIVNTHVSFGEPHAGQCARLAAFARDHTPAIVVGDFNADAAMTSAGLGFATAPFPAGSRPTRTGKSHAIDHAAALGARIVEVEVLDGRGLSDHNPVRAVIALALAVVIGACGKTEAPPEQSAEEPMVAPPAPTGPRRRGCSLDTPLAAWCFSSISYAYRDFAAAVGSPKLLRQRVAAAKVRRCEIGDGSHVVVTLDFDERGNLVASNDVEPRHPQRAEATWVEDRLATTKSTWMGGVTETLSSVTDDDCRTERTWGSRAPEVHACWSDGAVVVSGELAGDRSSPMLARRTPSSIAYPKGYRQEWDALGRIVRTLTGDGIEVRTVFEDGATRVGNTTWSLDARGLPTTRDGATVTCK